MGAIEASSISSKIGVKGGCYLMELAWWLIESCMMSKNEEKKKEYDFL